MAKTEGNSEEVAPESGGGVPVATLVRLGGSALLVIAVVVFILQNLDSVPVNFLGWSFDAPLIVLLAVAAVAGVALRWMWRYWRSRRRS